MIKINLLPIKATRKREYVKQQLILGVVLLLGALIGCYMWYSSMGGKIADKKKEIASAKQQIEQYKKAIGEVEKYKGLEDTLNRKLKIIESLIKGKTGPVKVLDRLSQVVPKQVWLMNWDEKSGTVTVRSSSGAESKVTLNPQVQFGSLQVTRSDDRSMLVATSTNDAGDLDDLVRWFSDNASNATGSL